MMKNLQRLRLRMLLQSLTCCRGVTVALSSIFLCMFTCRCVDFIAPGGHDLQNTSFGGRIRGNEYNAVHKSCCLFM